MAGPVNRRGDTKGTADGKAGRAAGLGPLHAAGGRSFLTPQHLARLPGQPGVYLFRGEGGEVLYVGKAKHLRSRVRSYFRPEAGHSVKTRELVRRAASVETIVVGSEAEALILEANLIKEHRPRFNIQLRDDKRYPYIKVTVREAFPRVYVTRTVRNDGSRYFGPFTSVGPLRQALDVVKGLYTVRSCRYDLPKEAPDRPCLDYHIGRCLAPCVGLQSADDYRRMIGEILRVLEGDTESLRQEVVERMQAAAESLRFEEAARLRDVARGLEAIAREQRVHRIGGGNRDVLATARDGSFAVGVVLRIRKGLLLGRDLLSMSHAEEAGEGDLLTAFTLRYYLGRGEAGYLDLPDELLLAGPIPEGETLGEILSRKAGRKVRVLVPRRGEKRRLVELAEANARNALLERGGARGLPLPPEGEELLFEIQERLGLQELPRLAVCFDVSHLQGTDTVASVVAFQDGAPKRGRYRRMRIQGEWGNDDVRSIGEAVTRYFRRNLEEGESLPNLVVVDGGRAQLDAAGKALHDLGLSSVPRVALAKGEEVLYLVGQEQPLGLPARDPVLRFLQRMRNEAHRFAVSYNRKLRKRDTLRSRLGDVPGLGPQRQQALLKRFGSVRGILEATEEEIARTPGIGPVLASRILSHLRGV